jgi:tryptophanyl-tRNA synthetase
MHSLNAVYDPKELKNNIKNVILDYLALGLDPNKSIIFQQSSVPEVMELQSVLNNVTPIGLMKRAHAYKAILDEEGNDESVNMGLFSYPILMAADILLYQTDIVPVGEDQLQHIEIARELARKFNTRYGNILTIPEPYIEKTCARIPGTCGKAKMSKSLGNVISIFASEEKIKSQIMKCVTDPARIHKDDCGDPDKGVVFCFLDLIEPDSDKIAELKERYRKGTIGDVELKNLLFESHKEYFKEAQIRRIELESNMNQIHEILEQGKKDAKKIALETIEKIRDSIGIRI